MFSLGLHFGPGTYPRALSHRRFFSAKRGRSITSLLRDFYSKVHPDLFGPYPEARASNEQSLKLLSQHLEGLQSARHTVPKQAPPLLKFFVKGKAKARERVSFRRVEIALADTSVSDNIYRILKACGLPTENLEPGPQQRPSPHHQQHHAHYQHHDDWSGSAAWRDAVQDSFWKVRSARHRRKKEPLLEEFLEKNLLKAAEKATLTMHKREQIAAAEKTIRERLGVSAVQNESGWNDAHVAILYRRLEEVASADKDRHELERLRGVELVFTHGPSGIDERGRLLLSAREQPATWQKFLLEVDMADVQSLRDLYKRQCALEKEASILLGGAQLTAFNCPPALYIAFLQRILELPGDFAALDGAMMRDLQLHIRDQDDLAVELSIGVVQVPIDTQSRDLAHFLRLHGHTAAHRSRVAAAEQAQLKAGKDACMARFGLEDITYATELHKDEIASCQRRLARIPETYPLLRGLALHIARDYAIREDGALGISWRFRTDLMRE